MDRLAGGTVKRGVLVTIVVLFGTVQRAAALGPLCCACLPDITAHTSGGGQPAIDALFCVAAPPANPSAPSSR
jgi:hypothetical protein